MFGSIKIALIMIVLASAAGAFTYVKDLQKTSEIHRLNSEKFEFNHIENILLTHRKGAAKGGCGAWPKPANSVATGC